MITKCKKQFNSTAENIYNVGQKCARNTHHISLSASTSLWDNPTFPDLSTNHCDGIPCSADNTFCNERWSRVLHVELMALIGAYAICGCNKDEGNAASIAAHASLDKAEPRSNGWWHCNDVSVWGKTGGLNETPKGTFTDSNGLMGLRSKSCWRSCQWTGKTNIYKIV